MKRNILRQLTCLSLAVALLSAPALEVFSYGGGSGSNNILHYITNPPIHQ